MPGTGMESFFEAREDWRNQGPPREAWARASKFFKELRKYERRDLHGKGIGRLALYSMLGGGGGSNFNYAFNYSTNPTGATFDIPIGEHFGPLFVDQFELDMLNQPGDLVGNVGVLNRRMTQVAQREFRAMSALMWSDGSGLISKGDGQYSVAGNVITLQNKADVDKWEVGDRLVFVSEADKTAADAGTQPPIRAFADPNPGNVNGYLEVTKVNPDTGELEVNVNVNAAIPTADPLDWIGRAANFNSAGFAAQKRKCLNGLFTYAPIRNSEAVKDLYGVARSEYVSRYAGWRIPLAGTESPWSIISKMSATANRMVNGQLPGDDWVIYIPGAQSEELSNEMQAQSVHVIKTDKSMMDDSRYQKDLCLGVGGTVAKIGGFGYARIIADNFLTDSTLPIEQDKTYVMFNMKDYYLGTARGPLGWRDYDNQGGPLHQVSLSQDLYGQFGAFGNLYPLNPAHTIIASPNANN